MSTAAATTRMGLIAPNGDDPVANGDNLIRAMAAAIDPIGVIFTTGTLAARPAAGITGRIYKPTDNNGLYWDTGAVWVTIVAPTVSALPGSPQDGDRVNYVADPGNGVVWPCVYRAADPSATKWQCVGAPPLTSEIAAQVVVGTLAYAATSGGPFVTLPLAGDYLIEHGAFMVNPGNNSPDLTFLTAKIGAASGADADAVGFGHVAVASAVTTAASMSKSLRRNGLAAGTVIAHYGRNQTGNNSDSVSNRWLQARPFRVG